MGRKWEDVCEGKSKASVAQKRKFEASLPHVIRALLCSLEKMRVRRCACRRAPSSYCAHAGWHCGGNTGQGPGVSAPCSFLLQWARGLGFRGRTGLGAGCRTGPKCPPAFCLWKFLGSHPRSPAFWIKKQGMRFPPASVSCSARWEEEEHLPEGLLGGPGDWGGRQFLSHWRVAKAHFGCPPATSALVHGTAPGSCSMPRMWAVQAQPGGAGVGVEGAVHVSFP